MSADQKPKTITPQVHIVNLMVQMANDCNSFAVNMGVKMAVGALERLTRRACELGDEQLLKELDTLGLVSEVKDEPKEG